MRALILLAGLFWLGCANALAATTPVPPASVKAVLKAAQPGDTLVFAGKYPLILVTGKAGLTLDLAAAEIDSLQVKASSDIVVQGGHYRPTTSAGAININGSRGVQVLAPEILSNGLVHGVTFRDSFDVTLTDARIDRARVGVALRDVTKARLQQLDLLGYAIDGIDIAASHDVDVGFFSCAGAMLVDDHHPDCVQLLGTLKGEVPSSDVRIHHFTVYGDTQGIGGYDHGTGGFRNITIENGTIAISRPGAVSLNAAPGSWVRDVKVSTLPSGQFIAKINTDATVQRCGNASTAAVGRKGVTDPVCAP